MPLVRLNEELIINTDNILYIRQFGNSDHVIMFRDDTQITVKAKEILKIIRWLNLDNRRFYRDLEKEIDNHKPDPNSVICPVCYYKVWNKESGMMKCAECGYTRFE